MTVGLMTGSVDSVWLDAEVERRVAVRLAELSGRVAQMADAEDALRRSEEQYRQVVNNVSEGIIVLQDGRFAFANPAALQITGYAAEDILGRDFLPVVHPDDRAKVADRHIRRLRGEEIEARYDFRVITKSGEAIWVELGAVMIEWGGRPATLSFASNVNERRRLEENIRQNLAEREIILENSIVGIAFLNPKGRLKWYNSALAQIFGLTRENMEGRTLEPHYLSREAYLETGAAVAGAVRDGRTFESEIQMRHIDGSMFWVHLSGKAVNATDLSKGTVWVVTNITARKALEVELKRTSSEREAILQSTLVGITYSIGRRHVWVNRKFAEMIGCEPLDLIGQSSLVHFPDEYSWRELGEISQPVLARGKPFSSEWQLKRHDGTLFWAQLFGRCVDPQDLDKGIIWTYLDITERKQAEEDIHDALEKQKELNYLKSRFVSMTSHEFRTPLSAILSSVQLLKYYGEKLPPEERRDLMEGMESAVKRMTDMLDDVLVIGKAESDRLEFRPAPLALRVFCERVVGDVRRIAQVSQGPRHEIEFRMSGDEADVALDKQLLQHILGNLLSNAVKYSPHGGKVLFDVACRQHEIEFSVADHGIGMPADDVPRLFETFFRASNVGNISGTGLGLAIVKRSVDLHGGAIKVNSKLGEGTCFVVTLPSRGVAGT